MSKRRRISGSTVSADEVDNKDGDDDASKHSRHISLLEEKEATITNQYALISSQRQYIHDILSNISKLDSFSKAHAQITEKRVEELKKRIEELENENDGLRERGTASLVGAVQIATPTKERDGEEDKWRGQLREVGDGLRGIEELVDILMEVAGMGEANQHGSLVFRGRGD